VWRLSGERLLIATVDFFTPLVDDARLWGAIGAANSASDVFAMGGRPLFALNVVAWPRDQLPLDLLGEVLAGADEVASRGGWLVAGGHTVDGAEPLFGQAVMGEVAEASLLTNAGARAGDELVLTKALGTGLMATAVKRLPPADIAAGGRWAAAYRAAIASMTTLNADAAAAALAAGAHAATDVTGFGLLGHLQRMAAASAVGVTLDTSAIPVLEGAAALAAEGFVPGGTGRNLDHVLSSVDRSGTEALGLEILADPQTSGGLLIACPPGRASSLVGRLHDGGHPAAVIGEFGSAPPGRIRLG